MEVPESLVEEHRELFHELRGLASAKSDTGKKIGELLTVLEPHFEKEEVTAMPLLGLLGPISDGKEVGDLSELTSLQRKLASDYPSMLREHAQVRAVIGDVRAAATKGGDEDAKKAMDELELHAKIEEEVLYPAALLVGFFARATATARSR